MVYPPYQIHHLPLHQQLAMPALETRQAGHYLVYWWKEIPLGHRFIQPREKLSAADYHQERLAAIKPALTQYATTANNVAHLAQLLLKQDLMQWNKGMEAMLTTVLPAKLPARVPVSVVICTRNRASMLRRCLAMLQTICCQPEEVVVVDNSPADNSSRQVVAEFPAVKYILESRPGLDFARNTGIQMATAPLIAFLDDDVVVHPWWVYRIWEAFQEPEVAAITGLVIASELQTEAQQIFERYWSFNRGYTTKIYDADYLKANMRQGPPVWEIGAGANMAFRKSVFQETGYFDERLDVGAAGCNGDSEMWFRVLHHGFKIRYTPLAVVHHEHRKEMQGLKKQIFYYMRGFAAAALLQQEQEPAAGYKKHLTQALPLYYARLIKRGFPSYKMRYRTLGAEMQGVLSGIRFYLKNRKPPLSR